MSIDPAPGRRGSVEFLHGIDRTAGSTDITVTPTDALPLIRSGKLDRRLFNVSGLVRDGFADSSDTLPLIVKQEGAGTPPAIRATLSRPLPSIKARAVLAGDLHAGDFWRSLIGGQPRAFAPGIGAVWLDGRKRALLEQSVPQVGAPAAWQSGITGKGVTVAVLDGGYDPEHADLAGVVTEARDFINDPIGARDAHGHGTHVASIVASTGAAQNGRYKGVAPDANLLVGKVCNTAGRCPDSAIIAGMEWAAAKGVPAVNMSLGGDATDGTDPVSQAVNQLTTQTGTLFVIAAGNSGRDGGKVGSPGAADAALTVGSVTKDDTLSDFSSTGPRLRDYGLKPDLVAPGEEIGAARAAGTSMGTPIDEHYTRASGTSMSTPHVTGAVALLAQQHPDWKAEQFKAALTSSSKRLPGLSVFQQGAGRLDLARATGQPVLASSGSLSFGALTWPRTEPVAKTVRYQNSSATPVTLDLTLDTDAPAGLFAVSAERVTVPANGSAEVAVTLNARPDISGLVSGRLVGTSGDTVVHTALGVFLEPESYNLTVQLTDRTGTVVTGNATSTLFDVVNLATGAAPTAQRYDAATGTHTLRVTTGDYTLNGLAGARFSQSDRDKVIIAKPSVTIDRDTRLVLDGRASVPISTTVERPSAAAIHQSVGFRQTIAGREYQHTLESFVWGSDKLGVYYITPTGPVTNRPYRLDIKRTMTEQSAAPGHYPPKPTNYVYNLFLVERGGVPATTQYTILDRDLAEVRTHSRVQRRDPTAPGGARQSNVGIVDGATSPDSPPHVPVQGTVTQYFSAGPDVRWSSSFRVNGEDDTTREVAPVERYRAGQRTDRTWNSAALSPTAAAARTGNTILLTSSPFAPSEHRHYWVGSSRAQTITTLSRDGKVVGTTYGLTYAFKDLPSGRGRYTLHSDASREPESSLSVLGARQDATWSFDSAAGPGTAELPLLTVRASGPFDAFGQAPAGRTFRLGLRVETPAGAPSAAVRELTAQVSFDDGTTWRPVDVARSGDRGIAMINHPAGAGFASLRFSAKDAGGNRVVQTMIRAYSIVG